ncbi:hypothetical protein [Paenibacillus thalictri]|nr:hypothetical protein [Paenibacillus thalictri]
MLLLLAATMSWSFVGILVKSASVMLDSSSIAFARFAFGVVALAALLLLLRQPLRVEYKNRWIWIGALGKSANYFFECIAIAIGFSYGNILVGPIQTVVLLLLNLPQKQTRPNASSVKMAG